MALDIDSRSRDQDAGTIKYENGEKNEPTTSNREIEDFYAKLPGDKEMPGNSIYSERGGKVFQAGQDTISNTLAELQKSPNFKNLPEANITKFSGLEDSLDAQLEGLKTEAMSREKSGKPLSSQEYSQSLMKIQTKFLAELQALTNEAQGIIDGIPAEKNAKDQAEASKKPDVKELFTKEMKVIMAQHSTEKMAEEMAALKTQAQQTKVLSDAARTQDIQGAPKELKDNLAMVQ